MIFNWNFALPGYPGFSSIAIWPTGPGAAPPVTVTAGDVRLTMGYREGVGQPTVVIGGYNSIG